MKLVAEGVEVTVGDERVVIDIYVNQYGNLVLNDIGHVNYSMLEEELSFSRPEDY